MNEARLAILIAAIERQEGFPIPGKLPTRLNNPGDLMFAHQRNATPHPVIGVDGKTRIYAAFPTLADGIAALRIQIGLDASAARHETLEQFIARYAPIRDGNDTSAYLAGVMRALGVEDRAQLLGTILEVVAT